MDNTMLIKWKSELEETLTSIEKKISGFESERHRIREQIGALATLLSDTEQIKTPEARKNLSNVTEADAVTGFLSILKGHGWSISRAGGKRKTYVASQKGKIINIWIKYSSLNLNLNKYWFGVSPEELERIKNLNGGVILLLGASNKHISFTFRRLQDLLQGATKAKTGQKFVIQEYLGSWRLLPGGTGEWKDVSQFYGEQGGREIGLSD